MAAHAIEVAPARAAIEACGARTSTIHIGFSAIEDLIVASGGLTGSRSADVALAIEIIFARAAVGADGTIRAAAIDAGFEAVGESVHARRGRTDTCLARDAVAILVDAAFETGRALWARRTAAIDVRFEAVGQAVRTLRRHALLFETYSARTIAVHEALHAIPDAVAESRTIASHSSAHRPVHRRRAIACVDGAWIVIIGRIAGFRIAHDVTFAVADIRLAISNGLLRDDGSRRRKTDGASAVDTRERLAFAACAAFAVGHTRHSTGTRAGRTARTAGAAAAIIANFRGTCAEQTAANDGQ